ncbi:MAG: hypothetical protein ACI90V_006862 [Bacillariaceae sp.]|jgi:hypothetical protein
MAAILCNGVGSCCEFVCTAPFKLCGSGCRGCSKACSSLCNGLCGSPLSAFVIVTVATQLPVVIVSAMELGGVFRCKGSDWLLGSLLVAIVHIVVAFYLSYRVTNGTDEKLRDRHTSWERISFLLCRDPFFAIYILIYLFFIAWLVVGSIWSIQNKMDTTYNASFNRCGNGIENNVGIVLGLGWAYFFIGPSVLSCILCCTCFSKKDYVATDEEFAAATAAQAAANNNNKNNTTTNNANDIESPPNNPPPQSESKTKEADPKPPRTYSVDGVPIDDDDDENKQNRKSSVNSNAAASNIPEVVAQEIPPPIPPPASAPQSSSASVDNVVDSVTKTVGGWFSGSGNSDSKKDSDSKSPPDVKATVY